MKSIVLKNLNNIQKEVIRVVEYKLFSQEKQSLTHLPKKVYIKMVNTTDNQKNTYGSEIRFLHQTGNTFLLQYPKENR